MFRLSGKPHLLSEADTQTHTGMESNTLHGFTVLLKPYPLCCSARVRASTLHKVVVQCRDGLHLFFSLRWVSCIWAPRVACARLCHLTSSLQRRERTTWCCRRSARSVSSWGMHSSSTQPWTLCLHIMRQRCQQWWLIAGWRKSLWSSPGHLVCLHLSTTHLVNTPWEVKSSQPGLSCRALRCSHRARSLLRLVLGWTEAAPRLQLNPVPALQRHSRWVVTNLAES